MIKKALLFAATAFALSTPASATKTYTREIKDPGGECGWDRIVESGNIDGDHHISCSDPGYSACWWTIDPPQIEAPNGPKYTVADDILPYVEQQIAAGVASGAYTISGTSVRVSWTSSQPGAYTFSVMYP